ncbi:hypothetical protein NDU88_001543, partial [Pleurodeles waltl]
GSRRAFEVGEAAEGGPSTSAGADGSAGPTIPAGPPSQQEIAAWLLWTKLE